MKTLKILILLALLIGMTNCGTEELNTEELNTEEPNTEEPDTEEPNTENPDMGPLLDTLAGINFVGYRNSEPYIWVKYDEIIGYDSAQHIFQINKIARDRIAEVYYPGYPDPHFGFRVALNNEIIYIVVYRPLYYSMSDDSIITFVLKEPDLIFLHLGYSISDEHFKGEDLRNYPGIIEQLGKDNKLIELEDFPYSG